MSFVAVILSLAIAVEIQISDGVVKNSGLQDLKKKIM